MSRKVRLILRANNLSKIRKSALNLFRLYSIPIIGFIVTYFFIKWNSIESWGQVSKYYLWLNIVCTVTNFGAGGYLMRQYSLEPYNVQASLLHSLLVRIPIIFISIIFIFCLKIPLELCFVFSFIIIVRTIQQSYETLLHYNREYKRLVIAEVLSNAILVALFYVLKSTSFQLAFIFIAYLIFEVIKTLIYVFDKNAAYKKYQSLQLDFSLLKKLAPFFLLSLVGLLNLKFDQLFSSLNFNHKQIGTYQLISSSQAVAIAFFTAIMQPFVKNIFRISSTTYTKLFYRFLFFVIPTSFVFSILLSFILTTFFSISMPISYILVIAVNIVLLSTNNYLNIGLMRLKMEMLSLKLNVLSLVVFCLFSIFIFNHLFEFGLMLAILFSQFLTMVLQLYLNFKFENKK